MSIIFMLQALMQNILTKLQESMKWVHGPWAQNFFVIEMEERILIRGLLAAVRQQLQTAKTIST